MNSLPAARGSQVAGFTQPRANLITDPCTYTFLQQISYRSNWFNLMIYGNCVHIIGYMIVTAWVSSIVTKCGARTGERRAGSKALTTD